MADYRRMFKRDGSLRAVERPQNRPYRRKTQPAEAVAVPETTVTKADTGKEPEIKVETASSQYPLETKRIGGTALFIEVAKQIGLWEDFSKTWGETACAVACSLACHWLSTAHNAAYLFKSWSANYALPFPHCIDGKEITEFFESLAACEGWEKTFFGARLARMPEDEIYSYDSTNIATKACEISDGQYGKSKDGGYRRQIGMSVLFGQRSGLPVMFRLFPGNIADVSTVVDLLSRVDMIDPGRLVAAVLDRGYFSLENIERCIDGNHKVLIAAKTGVSWVKDALESAMSDMWDARYRLRGCPVWGKTIEKELDFGGGKKHTVWVHVFRDDQKSHIANMEFFAELDQFEDQWNSHTALQQQNRQALQASSLLKYYKKPSGLPGVCTLERDFDQINEATRYFGFFASVSTMKCDAQQAIETYHHRDNIEKCFKAGKSDCNMDALRSHTEATMKGRFIVSFFALTVLSELRRRMRQPLYETKSNGEEVRYEPLGDEMTFRELLNYLDSIKVVYGRTAEDARLAEVTKRQCMIAKRLKCEGVYDAVPEYVKRK